MKAARLPGGSFQTAVVSRCGGRAQNEDHCGYVLLDCGACWVVADGLGGHRGGATASQLVVKTILESFQRCPGLTTATLASNLRAAHEALRRRQTEERELCSMQTTATLLISDYRSCLWAHVGDSRLYRFRGGRVVFQTQDHSVAQLLVHSGEITQGQVRRHEDRDRLLRTLGQQGEPRVASAEAPVPLERSDVYLLCTDGFWEFVTEDEMEDELAKSANPEEWVGALVSRILDRAPATHDNYTAIVAAYMDDGVSLNWQPPRAK